MRILITGAYGLIGSTMVELMPKFIEGFTDTDVIKVKCDDVPDCEPVDYIIHAAGYGQPLKFTQDKIKTIEINTKTTIELFKKLKKDGKFLYVSTAEVYSGAIPPYTEGILGTTTPQHPRACYIEGKRCGEAICMAYKEQGYDVKIARLALAYGATKLGDSRVLNQFIEQGLTKHITLRDSGEAVRTYCYAQDACELMWKILLNGKDVVYNVGGFSKVTIKQLAKDIGKIMKAKVTIPDNDTGLKDAPQDVCLDMTHTLKEFDQSFTPLSRGLRLTIKKYT